MKTIELTRGQVAKVDDEDFEWLNAFRWFAWWSPNNRSFYAVRDSRESDNLPCRTRIYMHRVIAESQFGEKTDHRNHDTLDNQRHNLRRCTNAQNGMNGKKRENNTSGFKGVSWSKERRKWQVFVTVSGKHINLGRYVQLEDAAKAYDAAARNYFGEFALTNFNCELAADEGMTT